MTVESSKKEYFFDNRISQRHISKGRLGREEFEQYLASLPDLIDACEDISEKVYGSEHCSNAACEHAHEDDEQEDEAL